MTLVVDSRWPLRNPQLPALFARATEFAVRAFPRCTAQHRRRVAAYADRLRQRQVLERVDVLPEPAARRHLEFHGPGMRVAEPRSRAVQGVEAGGAERSQERRPLTSCIRYEGGPEQRSLRESSGQVGRAQGREISGERCNPCPGRLAPARCGATAQRVVHRIPRRVRHDADPRVIRERPPAGTTTHEDQLPDGWTAQYCLHHVERHGLDEGLSDLRWEK